MGMKYSRKKAVQEPANELGSGAGIHPSIKRRILEDTTNILTRPFSVPFKNRRPAVSKANRAGRNIRKARLKAPRSYAEFGGEEEVKSDDATFDAYGNGTTGKRKNALLPRNFLGTMEQSKMKLTSKFSFPFKAEKADQFRYLYGRAPPPLGNRKKIYFPPKPLHDPMGEYAIVLYDPTIDIIPGQEEEEEPTPEPIPEEVRPDSSKGKRRTHKSLNEMLGINPTEDPTKSFPNVPVVIDPRLAKVLRPHQISGVKFLYRCTCGLVDAKAKGCIMADEMGLGKTLQCLTLMWTLLRQGPRGHKTIGKCVIVCPSSLVRNWGNEIDKWLGKGALNYLAMDGKTTKSGQIGETLQRWAGAVGRAIVMPVLIISYETLRRNVSHLKECEIGLILADEGHRLKNGDSLTFNALNSLNCERRVILSGTPIQNDLSEYFSLISFANPGLLGSRNEFRKHYELDILRGRDSLASDKEREKGDEKLQKLTEVVSRFIIRRTNDILSKYLPVKYEYVIFCNLSEFQQKLYKHFITSPEIKKLMKGQHSQPLKCIGILKKLCNHPNLLKLPEDIEGCDDLIPDDYVEPSGYGRNREVQTWLSGKFAMLERFLFKLSRETDDKIVVISNYTQTLDLVEKLCRQHRFGALRLDGSMNINKRQHLVDRFNDPEGKEFVFLLSSKAGGCGINLIGANRLVLMDPDWNPASDQQALARVWRDGQKKHCFIYRFISTGTIEEKIYQRQSAKLQLSSCVVDSNDEVERLFSRDDLRQLFQYNTNTVCETHATYKCKRCDPDTLKQKVKPTAMLYGDATTWNHICRDDLDKNEDFLIQNESQFDAVSYALQYVSH
ncbi:DEKNAAC100523 [Brettanomyces naardenensis]|uniref:DEKNAAC100523 n=1 Tax=Brettanomyces naardenensis TaxID=13370 RepID=A0A448YEQ5_BRENA|nr:DEKNAAC100523 [Brettanomyces naardenensis]